MIALGSKRKEVSGRLTRGPEPQAGTYAITESTSRSGDRSTEQRRNKREGKKLARGAKCQEGGGCDSEGTCHRMQNCRTLE